MGLLVVSWVGRVRRWLSARVMVGAQLVFLLSSLLRVYFSHISLSLNYLPFCRAFEACCVCVVSVCVRLLRMCMSWRAFLVCVLGVVWVCVCVSCMLACAGRECVVHDVAGVCVSCVVAS